MLFRLGHHRRHVVAEVAGADTGLLVDHHPAGPLYQIVHLPVGQSHGRTGDHDPGCPDRGGKLALGHPLLQLVAEGVGLVGKANRIVIKSDLLDQQGIAAADRGRAPVTQVVEPLQSRPLLIHHRNGGGQVVGGDGLAAHFFQLLLEFAHLFQPQHPILFPLHLGDLHHMGGDLPVKQLPGLLLGVTSGLTTDEINCLEVGRGFAAGVAVGRLDQGADIAG